MTETYAEEEVVKVTRVVMSTPVIDVPPPVKSHVAYTALL